LKRVGAVRFLQGRNDFKNKCKCRLPFGLADASLWIFLDGKMLYGYDLLDGFSSVEGLWRDDAFAESVLGSQGNKEEFGTFRLGGAF
jgi:hypothetical protein